MIRRLGALLIALLLLAIPAVANAAPGPASAPEWWFDTWNVPALQAAGADGHGITVAVIDTGVQANIPGLQGKVLSGADFIGNGSDGRTDYDGEGFSHGTAMASIIAAGSNSLGNIQGMAPAAKILPVAVPLTGVIRHGTPPADATSLAIDYAADHGAKVISMSLGGVRDPERDAEPCPDAVQTAVLHAISKGALVIAASGNSGDSKSPVEEPGVCLGVVAVGSIDEDQSVSSFSSRHPYLAVAAPGSQIPSLSRDPEEAYIGKGTSQATAITSAALAMIWSKFPDESGRQVLSRLLSTVTDLGPAGRDSGYGFGVIDPQRAIAAPVPSTTAANVVLDGAAPLLKLAATKPVLPKAVTAAGVANAPIGTLRIGSRSSGLRTAFWIVAAVAIGFVLLALALLVTAFRRRLRTA